MARRYYFEKSVFVKLKGGHWGCGQKPGLENLLGGCACIPMKKKLRP